MAKPRSDLDDVVLNLRGWEALTAVGSALNVIWVISHPDLVTAAEVRASDLAYAASTQWAAEKSHAWEVEIRPLLQCTDPELFAPCAGGERGEDVLFVGNSRGQARQAVEAAVAAQANLSVFGEGWKGLLDDRFIKGRHVPAELLGKLYGTANVVLNDHWQDMKVNGFISNRLFDIVASAGWAITDDVGELPPALDSVVAKFCDAEQLAGILADAKVRRPSQQALISASERVRSHHTFDARAKRLLQDVIAAGA
jgi:hypothetical protein